MSFEEEEKEEEETFEHTLLVVREVSVYKIPPRTTSGGFKCGEWLQSDKIWSGRLRVVSCKDRCEIRLEDSNSGDLFAACFVDPGRRENSVEPSLDSSRYFVLRIDDGRGKYAFIGLGFAERNEAFDFNVALSDHEKYVRREKEKESGETSESDDHIDIHPAVNHRLKEGETIRINVKPKPTTNGTGMLSAALSGNGKPLALAPPPTAATKTRSPLPPPPNDPVISRIASDSSTGNTRRRNDPLSDLSQLKTAKQMAAKDQATTSDDAIRVSGMEFSYEAEDPIFFDFNLDLPAGSRCLLVGANGSGKTTLLRILAGKHMVGGKNVVQVLSRSAFHDTQLVCSGDLSYLGGSWSKTVGSAGEVPLQGDFSAEHMIFGVEGIDPVRREKLIDLLDINLQWRMHKVSDGQKRRVQICMGLLHPFKVLLLDEVTVDLDVVARMDLLEFFKEECDQRGATIVYATHIFDGLETWATHLAYIQNGELNRSSKMADISEMKTSPNLLSVVESWLRSETKIDKKKKEPVPAWKPTPFDNSPFRSSRHMAYYR
ncbi:unnamed protein product [Brassica napus]|nr:unnamed protein product [Brassica napus]